MGHTGVGEKSDGRVLRSLLLNQSIPYPLRPSESTKKVTCYEWLCFHGWEQMNDSPAEVRGCPFLARTTVGGRQVSLGMALPQFCCLADLYPKAFLLPAAFPQMASVSPSQLHPTSTLDLTASALWSPSSPAFVGTEQCRVLA